MNDLKNKFTTYNLVKKYFSLNDKSLQKFKNALFYQMDTPNEYKFIDEAKDKRVYFDIDDCLTEENARNNFNDYKMVRMFFELELGECPITYTNYKNNKAFYNKQEFKLIKLLSKLRINNTLKTYKHLLVDKSREDLINDIDYKTTNVKIAKMLSDFRKSGEEEFLRVVDEKINDLNVFVNEIVKVKGTKKSNLKIVLSRNFNDYISVSSGNNTHSCLSLESDNSGAYWAGLPGTIMDKNRALVYITDGDINEVYGIKTPRMIYRSWLLTIYNKESRLNYLQMVRFYPHDAYKHEVMTILSSLFPKSIIIPRQGMESSRGRYYFEPLFHKDDTTSFIYQDTTRLKFGKKKKNKVSPYMYYSTVESNGGYQKLDKDGFKCNFTEYNFAGGLEYLMDNNEELDDVCQAGSGHECESCGERHDVYYREDLGGDYCEDCYVDRTFYCDCCNHTYVMNDDNCQNVDGALYCEDCFDNEFIHCDECGEVTPRSETYSSESGDFCESCYHDKYTECFICNEESLRNECSVEVNGQTVCNECVESGDVFKCDRCGEYHEKHDLINYGEMTVCNDCYNVLTPAGDLFAGVSND